MSIIEKKKQKEVNDIVAVIKMSSLLFCVIAFITNIFSEEVFWGYEGIIDLGVIIFIVSVFTLIYAFSSYYVSNEMEKKRRVAGIIEICIFIVIFFIVVTISGSYQSDYKFLFLFLIISTTIKGGLNQGLLVATLSSTIILFIDLFALPLGTVNIYFENDLVLVGVFLIVAWAIGYYTEASNKQISNLQLLMNEDSLTGLYNERCFEERLEESINLCRRYNLGLALMIIDLDYFKDYNDLYGREQGNEVLQGIASLLRECTKKEHIVSRINGGTFGIIVYDTSLEKAISLGESIRKSINDEYFKGEEEQPNGRITVSIGLAHYPSIIVDKDELLKAAEEALSKAKLFSRNSLETYNEIFESIKTENNNVVESVKGIIREINLKDKFSTSHVQRVVIYSKLIARELDLSKEEEDLLVCSAYVHDIGKVRISEEILSKNKRLTIEEWKTIMNHPKYSVELIGSIEDLESIIPVVLHHHERYDGSGYPLGLKGEEIPYLARILSVVDAFDAMTSYRPYNKIKTYSEAINELVDNSGTQFDPNIVNIFINSFMNGDYKNNNIEISNT